MEYDYIVMKGIFQDWNICIQELEEMFNFKEDNMQGVWASLDDIVGQFFFCGFSVEDWGGKFYVFFSVELFFLSGSICIDFFGKEVLC